MAIKIILKNQTPRELEEALKKLKKFQKTLARLTFTRTRRQLKIKKPKRKI